MSCSFHLFAEAADFSPSKTRVYDNEQDTLPFALEERKAYIKEGQKLKEKKSPVFMLVLFCYLPWAVVFVFILTSALCGPSPADVDAVTDIL